MKKWNQLFLRHGWNVKELERDVFDFSIEREENVQFLINCLEKANVNFKLDKGKLIINQPSISEESWIEVLDFKYRGRGEGLWFRSGEEEPKVSELDTYIVGIVRQLNRLGYFTAGSCDGHEKRMAHVSIKKGKDVNLLTELFETIGFSVRVREQRTNFALGFLNDRIELLDLAEKLSMVESEWLEKGQEFVKEHLFYKQLEELLEIPGESGNEKEVREYVKSKLAPFVDCIAIDHYGNLLAEKTYKSGVGPTILLNAHLDTVLEIEQDRVILKDGPIWSSSNGILGADDRAGVAVLLHTAEHLANTSFSGKVKFIFTVEEEIGLRGASNVDEYFLWGTDAAIVVDRRGTGDIVVSCGGYIPFCDIEYGEFFEKVANEAGMENWKTTNGGSSDTRIWAEHGIQSVNLSAGYRNEHSEDELLDVKACYRTAKLVKAVFENGRELRAVLRGIKSRNQGSRLLLEAN
jgi:tripeptide aminopeptidase